MSSVILYNIIMAFRDFQCVVSNVFAMSVFVFLSLMGCDDGASRLCNLPHNKCFDQILWTLIMYCIASSLVTTISLIVCTIDPNKPLSKVIVIYICICAYFYQFRPFVTKLWFILCSLLYENIASFCALKRMLHVFICILCVQQTLCFAFCWLDCSPPRYCVVQTLVKSCVCWLRPV